MLRIAAADDSGDGLAPISHRVPIDVPDTVARLTFTVHLTPCGDGAFIATCSDLPEVTAIGEDEREALERAEDAIREALAFPPCSPDIPS
jgi:hypothetical protein